MGREFVVTIVVLLVVVVVVIWWEWSYGVSLSHFPDPPCTAITSSPTRRPVRPGCCYKCSRFQDKPEHMGLNCYKDSSIRGYRRTVLYISRSCALRIDEIGTST